MSTVDHLPEFLANDKSMANIQLEVIKKEFDDRYLYLSEELSNMLLQLNNDEIIKQMSKDNASASHIQDRISELLKEAIQSEQEVQIKHLTEQLAIKSTELSQVALQLDSFRSALSKCETSLQQETQSRATIEKKLSSYKTKLKDMSSKNSESMVTQDKILKESKKNNEKVTALTEKIAFLEHELALKESMLKKKKKESSKDSTEIQQLKEDLDKMNKKEKEFEKIVEQKTTQLNEANVVIMKCHNKLESMLKKKEKESSKDSTEMQQLKEDLDKMKKKEKEFEKIAEQKTKQLNEANVLIMKCQNKLEKYKEKLEEETRSRQKNEKDFRRMKMELEEDLEREKKAFAELQREFTKRVSDKSEESERRLRDQYEAKIFAMQREINEKEQQFQKNNLENMIQHQLNSVRKSIQPDQTERMIEVYENKIRSYQQDYISKMEHQQVLRELEHRQKMEVNDIKKHLEAECKTQLRELDERKNKEFNFTLTNVKQAVNSLEMKMADLKTLADSRQELLEKETEKTRVLTMEKEGLASSVKELEESKKKLCECVASITQTFKSVISESRTIDFPALEMSAFPSFSKVFDVDELCKQLVNSFKDFREYSTRISLSLNEKVKTAESAMLQQKRRFDSTLRSLGHLFSIRVQQLKKELTIVRTTAEGVANSLKVTFSKHIDFLLSKIEDVNIAQQQKFRLMKNEHQFEMQELEKQWLQKMQDEREKIKNIAVQYQEKIDNLQEQIRELQNQKARLDQDSQMFQRKFDDFKRVLSLTNEFLSIPIDVQNGLLSNQKGTVEKFTSKLRDIFEAQKQEYEQTKQQLSVEYSNMKEELMNFKKLSDKLQQRCMKTENDLVEAKTKLEKVSTDYTTELNILLEQFTSLEKRHKEEIQAIKDKSTSIIQEMSVKFPELKGSYEKKLKSLEEQLQSDRTKVDSLKKDRQKMASELQSVRSDLNQALSEIAQKQQAMEQFSRKSQEQFHLGETKIDTLQKRLSERDRETERYAREKDLLERSKMQDKQEIERLQNMMEREFLQTSTRTRSPSRQL